MHKPFTPFIICKPEGAGICWPDFDTADGRPAVMLFTSGEKAKGFIITKGIGPEWQVGQMKQDEMLRWLRHNLLNGIPLVALDPGPTEGQVIEIFRFLAEVEGIGPPGQGPG
jgi:hypothetical protein